MRIYAILGCLGALPAAMQLPAQTGSPTFEVASIKTNIGLGNGTGNVRILPGGRLRAENAMLRAIIETAYSVRPFEIAGAPGWIDSARYDIDATASGEPNRGEMLRMLQALLEERFQLRVHRETREVRVFTLNVAKGGLKLTAPQEGGCTKPGPEPGPPMPPAPGQAMQLPCGRVMARIQMPNARLDGAQVEMADLARVLSNLLWRPVLDGTGYTGKFDMHVQFAADDAIGILAGPYRPDAVPPESVAPGAVSVFSAFQDQLGLKLESGKGPVEVLVIDSIVKPAAN